MSLSGSFKWGSIMQNWLHHGKIPHKIKWWLTKFVSLKVPVHSANLVGSSHKESLFSQTMVCCYYNPEVIWIFWICDVLENSISSFHQCKDFIFFFKLLWLILLSFLLHMGIWHPFRSVPHTCAYYL